MFLLLFAKSVFLGVQECFLGGILSDFAGECVRRQGRLFCAVFGVVFGCFLVLFLGLNVGVFWCCFWG